VIKNRKVPNKPIMVLSVEKRWYCKWMMLWTITKHFTLSSNEDKVIRQRLNMLSFYTMKSLIQSSHFHLLITLL
jgi:hypothetical protein